MRRLPVYFLIDVSESMVGDPIKEVQNGMKRVIQELRKDPYALETAFVSIVCFAGKAITLSPLKDISQFYPPTEFPIGSGTSFSAGLNHLMQEIESSVQKTTVEIKGDWKPIIYFFTDGNPTDTYEKAFSLWNSKFRKSTNLVAISIGDNVNTQVLGQITDNVLKIKDSSPESFSAFFKWVTASIKSSSMSVSETGIDEVKIPPTNGISLEKVDPKKSVIVDENFVVLHGKCSNTKQDYLIKFAKRLSKVTQSNKFGEGLVFEDDKFKLVGGYQIDGEIYRKLSSDSLKQNINTNNLDGQTNCPCCANRVGIVICCCGNIFCADPKEELCCPWCGMSGSLSVVGDGGANVNRSLG